MEIEEQIQDLKNKVEDGDQPGASESAFELARSIAVVVAAPIDAEVIGGPRGGHNIVYRVVPLEWVSWSHDVPLGDVTVHLLRAVRYPVADFDPREFRIVGSHPDHAKPRLVDPIDSDLETTDFRQIEQFADEAEDVWAAFKARGTK